MGQVLGLMKEYFQHDRREIIKESLPTETPIQPKKAEWRVSGDSSHLVRSYKFDSDEQLRWFVNEILTLQSELEHHAYVLINEKTVNIKVGTKALQSVTELDVEFASSADQIYSDSKYIAAENRE